MRLYTADLSKKFFGECVTHWAIAMGLVVSFYVGFLSRFLPALAFWHLYRAWVAFQRGKACDAAESGYVDISPGIQVVTLREDRGREREPEQILRN